MAGGKLQDPKKQGYAERMINRVRELREHDAFEPRPSIVGTEVSAARALANTRSESREARHIILVFSLVTLLIALVSLCTPYVPSGAMQVLGGETFYSPGFVLECYQLWFEINIAPLFDYTLYNTASLKLSQFAATYDILMYNAVINRAIVTLVVAACGIMLALSGLLFQTAFKNPLAVPSMLGVSDGVTLGCIIYVMLGNSSINADTPLYLALAYGFGAAVVGLVMFLSRSISGGRRYNVLDMLLLGTVICQFLGGFNTFYSNFIMDLGQWNSLFFVTNAYFAVGEPLIQMIVVTVFVVTMGLALLLRFRLNMVAFNDDEARMMGVRPALLRGLALVIGAAMQLAAIVTIGAIAMLSLVAPLLVRFVLPSDFRSQFLGNCLVGMSVLFICVLIQSLFRLGIVIMPVGTVVSILIIPFFVWAIAFGRGRWG